MKRSAAYATAPDALSSTPFAATPETPAPTLVPTPASSAPASTAPSTAPPTPAPTPASSAPASTASSTAPPTPAATAAQKSKKKRSRPSRDKARDRVRLRVPLTLKGVDALDREEASEYAKAMGVSKSSHTSRDEHRNACRTWFVGRKGDVFVPAEAPAATPQCWQRALRDDMRAATRRDASELDSCVATSAATFTSTPAPMTRPPTVLQPTEESSQDAAAMPTTQSSVSVSCTTGLDERQLYLRTYAFMLRTSGRDPKAIDACLTRNGVPSTVIEAARRAATSATLTRLPLRVTATRVCEWCDRVFAPQGLAIHMRVCVADPTKPWRRERADMLAEDMCARRLRRHEALDQRRTATLAARLEARTAQNAARLEARTATLARNAARIEARRPVARVGARFYVTQHVPGEILEIVGDFAVVRLKTPSHWTASNNVVVHRLERELDPPYRLLVAPRPPPLMSVTDPASPYVQTLDRAAVQLGQLREQAGAHASGRADATGYLLDRGATRDEALRAASGADAWLAAVYQDRLRTIAADVARACDEARWRLLPPLPPLDRTRAAEATLAADRAAVWRSDDERIANDLPPLDPVVRAAAIRAVDDARIASRRVPLEASRERYEAQAAARRARRAEALRGKLADVFATDTSLTLLTEEDAATYVDENILAVPPPGQTRSLRELIAAGAAVHAFLSCQHDAANLNKGTAEWAASLRCIFNTRSGYYSRWALFWDRDRETRKPVDVVPFAREFGIEAWCVYEDVIEFNTHLVEAAFQRTLDDALPLGRKFWRRAGAGAIGKLEPNGKCYRCYVLYTRDSSLADAIGRGDIAVAPEVGVKPDWN